MRAYMKYLAGVNLMIASAPGFTQQRDNYAHGHMWDGGGWFLGPIFMLLLLAAIVTIVLFLLKQTGGSIHNKHTTPTVEQDRPLEILKIRYANGEIDHEEFELRRKTLES